MQIGKIRHVPLREIWRREDADFTVWLEDNIDYLNEALDFDITVEQREKSVGPFSLDLYGEDTNGGKVIIENQLEKTDHDHLGKVLTYMSNLEAKKAVWISPLPREEHARAIDWLNEFTPDDIAFYLVKVEAIRIGDHPVAAPQFTVIKGPSEEVKQLGSEKKADAKRHQERELFWTTFIDHMNAKNDLYSNISPNSRQVLVRSMGMTGVGLHVYCTKKYVRTEIYMSKGKREYNKRIFDYLFDQRESIESAFGGEVVWERLDRGIHTRIKDQFDGVDWTNQEDWPRIMEFLTDSATRLEQAFRDPIKQFKLTN